MPEPCGALLFTADKGDPIPTTTTKTLPHFGVAFHTSDIFRAFKSHSSRGADTMRERLIVPESAIFQDKPAAWLANATPAFSLVAVPSDIFGRV